MHRRNERERSSPFRERAKTKGELKSSREGKYPAQNEKDCVTKKSGGHPLGVPREPAAWIRKNHPIYPMEPGTPLSKSKKKVIGEQERRMGVSQRITREKPLRAGVEEKKIAGIFPKGNKLLLISEKDLAPHR